MNGRTRVGHVNDDIEGDTVYIGRANRFKRLKASPFANPYVIGKPASHWIQTSPITRDGAITAYACDLLPPDGPKRHLLAELPALRGKVLTCWCRSIDTPMTNGTNGPDNRCHGDYLAYLLNTFTDDELRAMAREGGLGDSALS